MDLLADGVSEWDGLQPLAEYILQGEEVLVSFWADPQGSQHIHATDLERGAGLDVGAVNVFLDGCPLVFKLTWMAALHYSVDLWSQS